MNYSTILAEKNSGILRITINRPDKLNALNKDTITELFDVFDKAAHDAAIKVVILTGSGPKSFVAGADIAEFLNLTEEQGADLSRTGHRLFSVIEDFEKPVIAAINGFALGGGLELAMACHIRVASENAKMGLPEVTLGLIPGYGGTQRLPQLVGKGKAMEMIMTADMIDANEAKAYGLVNHVTTAEELIGKCEQIAAKIVQRSPVALRHAIKAVNLHITGKDGFEGEIEEFGKCFKSEDFVEGTKAFLEKRKANFPGK